MKITITKRKLTKAGKIMLWSNILLSLFWILSVIESIRVYQRFDHILLYSLIGIFLIIPIISFWMIFSIEDCFMEKYSIKLDAKRDLPVQDK